MNRNQSIAGNLSLVDIAGRLQRPIDYVFPFDKRVIAAANLGQPVGLHSMRFSGFSKMLQQLVSDVETLSTGANETIVSPVAGRMAATPSAKRSTADSFHNDADNWLDDADSKEHA